MASDREPGVFSALRYEVADAVATITLDRPAALNALTIPLKQELLAALRTVERDRAIRAVVLTGAGRAFCAGQDLKERLEPDAAPLEIELRERYNPIIAAMRRLDQPIVGAINGVAAGAGASLAFACDLRIAAEGASFVLAFERIGLVPDSGATWFLPRLVGPAKAAELALLGEALSAADAERLGLVARVVPADALADEARSMALRLAGLAPRAVALTKRALQRSWSVDLDEALEDEAYRQGIAGASADHAEGLAAFLDKRPPRFSGE
ncbi:MAG TPA: enoyl-CoA hydratase-related protein [Candidatus Limnocylindrales bacterium]|nr:enoyl-CoA hydratase-related protein [Candidatus Limnocylindrales bacterium]